MNKTIATIKRSAAGALGAVALVVALAGPADAATGRWYAMPSKGYAKASAIMDRFSSGNSGGSAAGRVTLSQSGGCYHVQYAPYAHAAKDGGWNKLPRKCGSGSWTFNWSDRFHLAYNGFKFRLCSDNGCADELHIGR